MYRVKKIKILSLWYHDTYMISHRMSHPLLDLLKILRSENHLSKSNSNYCISQRDLTVNRTGQAGQAGSVELRGLTYCCQWVPFDPLFFCVPTRKNTSPAWLIPKTPHSPASVEIRKPVNDFKSIILWFEYPWPSIYRMGPPALSTTSATARGSALKYKEPLISHAHIDEEP